MRISASISSVRPSEPPELYERLGAKIAESRKRRGWSQTTLAAKADLTRGSVANIETGRQKAPLDTLWRIGKALGIEPRLLIPSLSEIDGALKLDAAAELTPDLEQFVARLSTSQSKVKTFIREAKFELGDTSDEEKRTRVHSQTGKD